MLTLLFTHLFENKEIETQYHSKLIFICEKTINSVFEEFKDCKNVGNEEMLYVRVLTRLVHRSICENGLNEFTVWKDHCLFIEDFEG